MGFDKVAHFFAFGGLLWALGILFRKRRRIALAASAIALGALTEIAQGFLGRDASWLDLLADMLGVGVALVAWSWWRSFEPRAKRAQASTRAI